MHDWAYDVAVQCIAGAFSGLVVGLVLLRSQFRHEQRSEEERRLLDDQRDVAAAALKMHQLVTWAAAGVGDQNRVAEAWNLAHSAAAEWAALEAARTFPNDVVELSTRVREELRHDLLAVSRMGSLGGVEASQEHRARWTAIAGRKPFEVVEPLLARCKRARC